MTRAQLRARVAALQAEDASPSTTSPFGAGDLDWDLYRHVPAWWRWLTDPELEAIASMRVPPGPADTQLYSAIEAAAIGRSERHGQPAR